MLLPLLDVEVLVMLLLPVMIQSRHMSRIVKSMVSMNHYNMVHHLGIFYFSFVLPAECVAEAALTTGCQENFPQHN